MIGRKTMHGVDVTYPPDMSEDELRIYVDRAILEHHDRLISMDIRFSAMDITRVSIEYVVGVHFQKRVTRASPVKERSRMGVKKH